MVSDMMRNVDFYIEHITPAERKKIETLSKLLYLKNIPIYRIVMNEMIDGTVEHGSTMINILKDRLGIDNY